MKVQSGACVKVAKRSSVSKYNSSKAMTTTSLLKLQLRWNEQILRKVAASVDTSSASADLLVQLNHAKTSMERHSKPLLTLDALIPKADRQEAISHMVKAVQTVRSCDTRIAWQAMGKWELLCLRMSPSEAQYRQRIEATIAWMQAIASKPRVSIWEYQDPSSKQWVPYSRDVQVALETTSSTTSSNSSSSSITKNIYKTSADQNIPSLTSNKCILSMTQAYEHRDSVKIPVRCRHALMKQPCVEFSNLKI